MKKLLSFLTILSCTSYAIEKPLSPSRIPGPAYSATKNIQQASPQKIRVLSYNLHSCVPVNGKEASTKGIAEVIKKNNPDIAFLQEVDAYTKTSGPVNQAADLAKLTGLKYFYFGEAIHEDGGLFGVAILSKYPLINPKTVKLPLLPAKGYVEQRVLCYADVKLLGKKLYTIATSHFDLTDRNRLAAVPVIDSVLARTGHPVIFGGDFNVKPGTEVINALDKCGFVRTCTQDCLSFPALKPTVEIDYITYRPAGSFNFISHYINTETAASDHCPVITEIGLK